MMTISSLQGAALTNQAREKRDTVEEKMDKTFDFLGVHLGFKYKDNAYPWKGGKMRLIIEDPQKIIQDARSNRVEMEIDVDNDIHAYLAFKTYIKYSMMHYDGSGEERGNVMIKNSFSGSTWSFAFKSEASPFTGLPILPAKISNQEFKIKAKPRANDVLFIIKANNGAKNHDLTVRLENLSSEKGQSLFQFAIEGNSLGKSVNITGKFKETRFEKVWDDKKKIVVGDRGSIWVFDLEKEGKTLMNIETTIKELEGPLYINLNFEAKTKYSLLGGKIAGIFLIRLENGPMFTVSYTDDRSKHSVSFVMTWKRNDLRHNMQDLEIEVTENKESILTSMVTIFRSGITLDVALLAKLKLNDKSKINKFLKEKHQHVPFNEGNMNVQVVVDMQNWNIFGPQLKFKFQLQRDGMLVADLLADTTVTPYSFKLPKLGEIKIYSTDNSLSIKSNLEYEFLEHNITWEGNLPLTMKEAVKFFSKNNILVKATKIYKFPTEKEHYGTFKEANMNLQVFFDMQNWNLFVPHLKIKFQLLGDGILIADFHADTTSTPYSFKLPTATYISILGKSQPTFYILVHHQPDSLLIDSDILGGLKMTGELSDNETNGKNVSLSVRRRLDEMCLITGSTEMINNDDQFRIVLHNKLDINPDLLQEHLPFLYKTIFQYNTNTPFKSMTGKFGIDIDKKDKNTFLNKLHAFGEIKRDGKQSFGYWISTSEQPYQVSLFAPSVLDQISPGMSEAEIFVEQSPENFWHIITNIPKLGEIKIYNTDNSFTTKLDLGAEFLEPNLTWEGHLPMTWKEAEKFFSRNNILLKVTGLAGPMEVSLQWDLNLYDEGKISLRAEGNNKRWGAYSISRNINWKVEDKIVDLNITGISHFAEGILATSTPTETLVKAKILLDDIYVEGKFMKKVDGKEYSVDLSGRRGMLPKIIWGQ